MLAGVERGRWRRWCLHALLALLVGLWGSAVGARPFTVALQLEPPMLDPTAGAASAIGEVTYRTIFEGLTTLDATGQAVPLLATGWTRAADARSYVFHLREEVRFSDGSAFDARVAAWSLAHARRPGSPNPQAAALAGIVGLDVLDAHTLRIRLSAPDAGLPALLARPGCVMVPPRAAATLAVQPIGTGPFRFGGWARGDRLTLVRNDDWWRGRAQLPRIDFRFINDPAAAYAAVRTHAVDLFPDYPAPENLEAVRRDPRLAVSVAPSEGEVILALNNRAGPLADLRVRRAIAHALDRRAIIAGAMSGYATPIGSHYPPQGEGYVDLVGLYPHDPGRARALLTAAGYPRGFAATLAVPPASYARRTGEIVAAELAAVGIRVTLLPLEWPQWLDRVFARHAYDMTVVSHAEAADYDIYGRTDYYFNYDGPEVRALLAQLKATTDARERRGLLGRIQRRIAGDAVNAFLFQFPHLQVADARLRDAWVNTPLQAVDFGTLRLNGRDAGGDTGQGGSAAAPVLAALLLAGVALAGLVAGPGVLLTRLGVLLLTLAGASLLVFWTTRLAPGDPAQFMLGMDASPQAVTALRGELGLGGSAMAQYADWAGGLLRGDLGTSYTYRVPVASLVGPRLAVSLPLAGLAMVLAVALGLVTAIAGAAAGRRWPARLLDAGVQLGLAVPSFWLASLLLLLFAVRLGWVSAAGWPGWGGGFGPALGALLLPAVALGLPQAAVIARVAGGALARERQRDYVRTARASGIGERRILRVHVLPNALPPILAVVGLQAPFLLAGSVVVETVFGLPGLGRLVLDAIGGRDLLTVGAVAMLLAGVTVLASFLVDLAQALADPRVRQR